MDKHEIRADLRNGVSIDAVCRKYKVSLLALMDIMKDGEGFTYSPSARKSNTGELYIYKKGNGFYYIRKGGGDYGIYRTVTDARKVRDYFIYHGWRKSRLDEVCEAVGVERVKKKGRY